MKKRTILILCLATLLGLLSPEARTLFAEEPDDTLAAEVRAVLSASCARCHGALLRRPKGEFGHVTDLARLASEPRYVVRGRPELSLLYTQLVKGEMPPPKSPVPPLSAAERETVRRWISAGAPALPAATPARPGTPTTQPAAKEPLAGSDATPARPEAYSPSLARRIGQYHPALVHFPVALILSALLAELLALLLRRPAFSGAALYCLVLGTIGSVLAGVSGWYWADAEGFEAPLHRWLGLGTTAFALASCLLAWQARGSDSKGGRTLYRLALLLTAVLLVLAGHAGGDLTFGRDHYVSPW